MNDLNTNVVFERQVGGALKGQVNHSSLTSQLPKESRMASIPTRFVNTFFEQDRAAGFGSSSMRFNYLVDLANADPGPGRYKIYKEKLWKDNRSSNSRKGYGGFLSKVQRKGVESHFMNTGPGPGTYTYSNELFSDRINSKKSRSVSNSSKRVGEMAFSNKTSTNLSNDIDYL